MKVGQEFQEQFDFGLILQEHQANNMLELTNAFSRNKLRKGRRNSRFALTKADSVLGGSFVEGLTSFTKNTVETTLDIANPMNLGTNVKKLGKTTVSGFKNVGSGMKSMFKFKSEENNNNYKSSEVKSSILDKTVVSTLFLDTLEQFFASLKFDLIKADGSYNGETGETKAIFESNETFSNFLDLLAWYSAFKIFGPAPTFGHF